MIIFKKVKIIKEVGLVVCALYFNIRSKLAHIACVLYKLLI